MAEPQIDTVFLYDFNMKQGSVRPNERTPFRWLKLRDAHQPERVASGSFVLVLDRDTDFGCICVAQVTHAPESLDDDVEAHVVYWLSARADLLRGPLDEQRSWLEATADAR